MKKIAIVVVLAVVCGCSLNQLRTKGQAVVDVVVDKPEEPVVVVVPPTDPVEIVANGCEPVDRGALITWTTDAEGKDVQVFEDGYEKHHGRMAEDACDGITDFAADVFGAPEVRDDVLCRFVCTPSAWLEPGEMNARYANGLPARVPWVVEYRGETKLGVVYWSVFGPADCFSSDHWEVEYKGKKARLFSPNMKTATGTWYNGKRIDAHGM